jgi:hypothetical protein
MEFYTCLRVDVKHEVKAKEFEGTRYCVSANIHSTSFLKEYLQPLTRKVFHERMIKNTT